VVLYYYTRMAVVVIAKNLNYATIPWHELCNQGGQISDWCSKNIIHENIIDHHVGILEKCMESNNKGAKDWMNMLGGDYIK
jgi:hypothetical protein